uniref:Uncharacterized protein n=1 Tax=Anopheles melas TaxID=34690 RepID=A0A182TDL6_9DIPT
MNLQQVVLSLGVFTTLLRDQCYGDEDTEHVHIKLHVPEIINRHVHVKTKYMHVYHPKKVVQEMPPTFVDQQPMAMDHAGMWMPSGALPSGMVSSPSAALSSASSSAMAAAAAASLSSMVQDKLSTQLAQELMMRYRNLETPTVGGGSNDLREPADASDYLRDYYRQQRKLSDQLMLQEAMQLPNFAQTKYLSSMGYNWDKSFADRLQQRFNAPTCNRLIVTFNLLCNFARHFAPVHLTVASRDRPGCMRATAIAV